MCKHWLVYMAVAGGVPTATQTADFTEITQVITAAPIYGQAAGPGQECRTKTATPSGAQERSCGGAVPGGMAGAIIGH